MKPTAVPTIFEGPVPPDALQGDVRLSPAKAVWALGMYGTALFGGWHTFAWDAFLVFVVSTVVTLCLGHSLGMHRRFIHASFQCPKWLEYFLVHQGVLVGLAGPHGMVRAHDMRDWAQRQSECHPFFSQQSEAFKDWFWQLFCEVRLVRPPVFVLEPRMQRDPVHRFMEATWMLQQLPLALVLFSCGGWAYVVWGIAVRVSVSITGHWLIGYLAHNGGPRNWHIEGAGVQGYNIPFTALLTMGENWHNNHHAFPGSAKLGLKHGELDPGWLVLCLLKRLGLVWDVRTPEQLTPRTEVKPLPAC
jgi:stearoyl-CoA desaturase (delta-9 desaturase)